MQIEGLESGLKLGGVLQILFPEEECLGCAAMLQKGEVSGRGGLSVVVLEEGEVALVHYS